MINKAKIRKISQEYENAVYSQKMEIIELIILHARLGLYELEVFATKSLIKKIKPYLEKRGFYVHENSFESVKKEALVYISWLSSLD